MLYNIKISDTNADVGDNIIVKLIDISFGEQASNDKIVKELQETVKRFKKEVSGSLLLVNAPASLPVNSFLTHAFCHLAKAMGFYDPKLNAYLVTITHDPQFKIGDLITIPKLLLPVTE